MKVTVNIPDGYNLTNDNSLAKLQGKTVFCIGLEKIIIRDFYYYVDIHLYRYPNDQQNIKELEFKHKRYENMSLSDRIALLESIMKDFENVDTSTKNLILSLTSDSNTELYQKLKEICPIEFLNTFK